MIGINTLSEMMSAQNISSVIGIQASLGHTPHHEGLVHRLPVYLGFM